ncbi:hypothetical protein [Streptomyces sp. NPDC048350]|uniref:hypothetical protein n=1 Tax=Streptomyces sp. NPDC048350 TaxID=3365538 RepID=UPI00371FE7A4
MANGVWHAGLDTLLELDKPDLGLGNIDSFDVAQLLEELLRPVAERGRHLLLCVESKYGRQCKAEMKGVQSPYMYVRKHRGPDGKLRLRAAHLPTSHEMTAEESDQHKAMKDFVARTVEAAGLKAYVEKSTKFRTSRPDVTVVGDGGANLGCEAQYYNASPGTVLRRSKAHASAGLSANWITHDSSFHLVDRANWMLTQRRPWRQIADAADLPLVGGYRVLAEWYCSADAERPCPDSKLKTGCNQTHLEWDTPLRLADEGTGWTDHTGNRRGITVGRALVGAATGSVVSLFVPSPRDPRAGSHMWVPASDLATWSTYRPIEKPSFQSGGEADDQVHFSGRDAELNCHFGEERDWRPSAQLQRRGYGALSITVDGPRAAPSPATRTAAGPIRLQAPNIPRPQPGVCEIGSPRCGQVARPYPAGWRCETHRPGGADRR